ncbi:OmpA family protein [Thalassospira xiamenensis]|uniref:Outer membrane protein OmpA n=1 Tax=Thalassospira xiamenensis TaxID=220697 RepID=A0A285RQK8_9PROT|nr:OmpA family protein [Thalassospira xiamenensis]SOB96038.1 Outer membrane protein OmpA [Thalassospira xiamenensis]
MRAKLLFAVSAAAFLGACANMDIPGVRGMADEGSAFDAALHQGYSDLAQAEYEEADWVDARYFTNRAKMAAMGQDTGPQPLADRDLPENGLSEISVARADMIAAFDAGGRDKSPQAAGRTQVGFDCWMQELEENIQQEDIDNCRAAFYQALAIVQADIAPSESMAKAAPMMMPEPMNIYFAFDSAVLGDKAMPVVTGIVEAYEKYDPKMISLTAYADRAGDAMYNDMLAKSRVDAVVKALRDHGISPSKLAISISGEANVPVPTADGVAEQGNRVVTVKFEDGM